MPGSSAYHWSSLLKKRDPPATDKKKKGSSNSFFAGTTTVYPSCQQDRNMPAGQRGKSRGHHLPLFRQPYRSGACLQGVRAGLPRAGQRERGDPSRKRRSGQWNGRTGWRPGAPRAHRRYLSGQKISFPSFAGPGKGVFPGNVPCIRIDSAQKNRITKWVFKAPVQHSDFIYNPLQWKGRGI